MDNEHCCPRNNFLKVKDYHIFDLFWKFDDCYELLDENALSLPISFANETKTHT